MTESISSKAYSFYTEGASSIHKLRLELIELLPVAIGTIEQPRFQDECAIAIGGYAGFHHQGTCAIAIGEAAGQTFQGMDAIALGSDAASIQQGENAIAIGVQAGAYQQGTNAIAIGFQAGMTNQPQNSIVLNASSVALSSSVTKSQALYIAPLQDARTTTALYYNSTSKEVSYATASTARSGKQSAVAVGAIATQASAFATIPFGVTFSAVPTSLQFMVEWTAPTPTASAAVNDPRNLSVSIRSGTVAANQFEVQFYNQHSATTLAGTCTIHWTAFF